MTEYHRVSLNGGSGGGADIDETFTGTRPHTHRGRLVTICIVLTTLVAAHATLISLWSMETLQKHLFSLDKVSEATQAVTVGTQATITALLVALSYAVQGVAADQIIRRSKSYEQCYG